jgi:hypothetical protein
MKADQTSLSAQNPDNRLIAIEHTVYVTVKTKTPLSGFVCSMPPHMPLFASQESSRTENTICPLSKLSWYKVNYSTFPSSSFSMFWFS